MQHKRLAAQIEQAETRKRNAQNPSDQKAAEEMLSTLKASDEMWLSQEQEYQIEQTEAETQFRAEQAKMNDLQAQLDKLDRLLAGSVSQQSPCGQRIRRSLITTLNTASLTSAWAVLDGRHNRQVFSRYPVKGNTDIPHVREYTPHEIAQAVRSAGFQTDALFTERMDGAQHATWVLDILRVNAFETALRGEQILLCRAKADTADI